MNEITMENLADVLAEIARDGSKIIRTDSGNGCAGPMLVEPSDLLEDMEQFDRVVSVMDLCDADLAHVVAALGSFGMLDELAGFPYVAIASSQTGEQNEWIGFYLLWVPGGEILTTEQVGELRAKWEND